MDKIDRASNSSAYFEGLKDHNSSFKTPIREIVAPVAKSLYLPDDKVDQFWSELELEVSNIKKTSHQTVIVIKGDRFDDLNDLLSFDPKVVRNDVEKHIKSARSILRHVFEHDC